MNASKGWPDRLKYWHEVVREPGLTALLIIEGTLIFLLIPLSGIGMLPQMVVPVAFVVLVLAILVVTWHSHVATVAVLIAVVLSPVGTLLWREDPSPLTQSLSAGGRLLAIAAVSLTIARVVFGSGRVSFHRVQGAVLLYLNFALMFFTVYRLMDGLLPNVFHFPQDNGMERSSGAALLYFSFTTLTTLGYGDITPIHPLARSLANLEAVIGQLYPATLLARLVSLEIEHRRRSRSDR
jgi:Ion channel